MPWPCPERAWAPVLSFIFVSDWQSSPYHWDFLQFLIISTRERFHAELKLHIIFEKILTFLYIKKESNINFLTQLKVFNTECRLSDKLKE